MRVARGAFLLLGGTLSALAVVSAYVGDARLALGTALIGVGALLMATWAWAHPTAFPLRQWVAVGAIAVGLVVTGAGWLAVGFVVFIAVVNVATSRFMFRRLGLLEFEETGPESVMAEARPTVAAFEAEGFQRVGGYRARIPLVRREVTATVMRSPEGDRFTVVTDRVWEVVSRYGPRWLITTSSGLIPLPGHILRQTVPRGRPAELVEAHRSAASLLEGRGLEPDRLGDGRVLGAAQDLERQAIQYAAGAPISRVAGIETRRASDDPALAEDDRGLRRIDEWLAAAES